MGVRIKGSRKPTSKGNRKPGTAGLADPDP
jgi:hypothetical protein